MLHGCFVQCPAVLPHRSITAVGLTPKNCTAVAVSGCGVSCGVQVWCAVCSVQVRCAAYCSQGFSLLVALFWRQSRRQDFKNLSFLWHNITRIMSQGGKKKFCGILAVFFSAIFWRYFSVRYFSGIFQCLKLPIRYRYLGIWKKNTAYRHRTDFFPTAGHCLVACPILKTSCTGST